MKIFHVMVLQISLPRIKIDFVQIGQTNHLFYYFLFEKVSFAKEVCSRGAKSKVFISVILQLRVDRM